MHFRSGKRTIRGVAVATSVRGFAKLLPVLLLLAGAGSGCRSGTEVDFNADIRPVLNDKCVVCHGGVRRRANLSLLFRDDALRPAKSGKPAIVPGNPAASELIRRVADHNPEDRMPKEMDPLTEDEIDTFRRWIAEGADWSPHWAYVAPERPNVPSTDDSGWPRTPLDAFVLTRLEREGLRPSPEADCPVLVRRVSLDLIGLPPTTQAVSNVCGASADVDDERYLAYVDSLLASPRFGERWAAMWLDLARYADSQGYEKDGPRSIWRYRDWVVNAFNSDMPFDQFTIEQLAGDLLPNASFQQKLATAFHRNAMTNTEGGTDDEEHRVAAVIDRVNTTFEVWQSTSAGCAQCHGHPFDPLRHEEYYQLFAFFNNTPDWDQPDEYPIAREFEPQDSTAARAILARLERVSGELDSLADTPDLLAAHAKWETELDDPKVVGSVVNTWQNELLRIVKIPAADRTPAQAAYARRMFVETQPQFEALRKERRAINGELAALNPIITPILEELPADRRRETHVFERGNFLLPTTRVDTGIPAFLPQPEEQPGTRLDLASWLMSSENPLTSRVIVNRFWEQLFGLGIVETLEDFGTEGSTPTHPDLLDWLAIEFRDELDWGVKSLLRTLVVSATYRQSSSVTPELLERDPRNLLLARGPRFRLTAEQVRDQALAAAGLLSDKMFGPSVMPPQPDGIWQNPYSSDKWITPEGEDKYRRALYTYWRRTAPYPSMITFDSPSREFCVSRRVRTNTPLQALVTLNDPVYVEAAEALAKIMETSAAPDVSTRIAVGYQTAMGYQPAPGKLATLVSLHDDVAGARPVAQSTARSISQTTVGDTVSETSVGSGSPLFVVANAIMNTDEFLTKE